MGEGRREEGLGSFRDQHASTRLPSSYAAMVVKAVAKVVQPKVPQKIDLVLDWLRAPPRLQLRGVQKLKISLAYRNDHFGAR